MINRVFGPVIGICLVLVASSGQGAPILRWNTAVNAGTETIEPSVFQAFGLQASTLTLGVGVNPAGNANRFGGNNWFDSGDTSPTTLAQAIDQDEYIQFVVTPNSGFMFSAESFQFIWHRSGTGPSGVALRSSFDGFANNLGQLTSLAETSTTNTFSQINISGLNNIQTATTFRLYGFGATGTTGSGGFDIGTPGPDNNNVIFNGSVAAVPEPSSLAMLALCGIGGVIYRRKRNRTTTAPSHIARFC